MLKKFVTPTTKRLIVHSGWAGIVGLLLTTWLQIKPLGILFLLILCFWFYKTKFGAQIVPPDELKIKANTFLDRLKSTRQANPTFFCVVTSACLGSLAILGHLLSGSGVVLILLIIAVLLSTKYNFKILKLRETNFEWKDRVQENEIDEFLPEVNETNMGVLERASDQSTNTLSIEDAEEKSEEIPSDLLIPDCIPEIDENSTDEDDALGIGVPEEAIRQRPSATLSEIEFKKGHFKKDSSVSTSSSSDEENLSKGLKFPEYSNVSHEETAKGSVQRINPQTQSMIITNNILPNLVSGIVSWASMTTNNRMAESLGLASPNRAAPSDDEESDFEIVNTEEYQ